MYGPLHTVTVWHAAAGASPDAEGRWHSVGASAQYEVPANIAAASSGRVGGLTAGIYDASVFLPLDAPIALNDMVEIAVLYGREYAAGRYTVKALRGGRRFMRVLMTRSGA